MGMTLPEALAALEPNTLVYIGSKSSYFAAETARELLAPGRLDEISDGLFAKFAHYVERGRVGLVHILAHPPALSKSMTPSTAKDKVGEYLDEVRKWVKQADMWVKSYNNAARDLLVFVPLEEREVKDQYQRISDNGVVIIVTGSEMGEIWFVDEKKQKERKNGK